MCLFFTNLLRLQNRIKLVRKRLHVLAYIERTKDEEMFDFCFFSLHKLHKAEISYTIARWIKHVFTSFRIHGFGAPSTQELQHQLLLRLVGLWTILWVLQIGLMLQLSTNFTREVKMIVPRGSWFCSLALNGWDLFSTSLSSAYLAMNALRRQRMIYN